MIKFLKQNPLILLVVLFSIACIGLAIHKGQLDGFGKILSKPVSEFTYGDIIVLIMWFAWIKNNWFNPNENLIKKLIQQNEENSRRLTDALNSVGLDLVDAIKENKK